MQKSSFLSNIISGLKKRYSRFSGNPYKQVGLSFFKIKILKHLSPGKIRRQKMFGSLFYYHNPQEFLHGLKEIFVDRLYYQTLQEQPYIIDCGANIGMSVIYMKQLYPKAEIVAFEPDERNFELLEKNIQSFGYDGVTLKKAAVWNDNKPLLFAVTGTMSSSIATEKTAATVSVDAYRLKDLINKKVDFLKIDIEGAEYCVVKDIMPVLEKVTNLFIEYHGTYEQNHELADLISSLTQKGFQIYIKEATSVYDSPFVNSKNTSLPFDIQLNIFCKRK